MDRLYWTYFNSRCQSVLLLYYYYYLIDIGFLFNVCSGHLHYSSDGSVEIQETKAEKVECWNIKVRQSQLQCLTQLAHMPCWTYTALHLKPYSAAMKYRTEEHRTWIREDSFIRLLPLIETPYCNARHACVVSWFSGDRRQQRMKSILRAIVWSVRILAWRL